MGGEKGESRRWQGDTETTTSYLRLPGKRGRGRALSGAHITSSPPWVGGWVRDPCTHVALYPCTYCTHVPLYHVRSPTCSQPASGLTRFSAGLKVSFTKFLLEHFIHSGSLSLKSPFASRSLSKFYKKGFEWRLRCIILALT